MIAWQSKISVFVGSKVILVTTPNPTEGEVKPGMFDGPFLGAFPANNLSLNLSTQKVFLTINNDLINQQTLIYLT